MYEENEQHRAERDEERSARYGLTEVQRAGGCRHGLGLTRTGCALCGDDPR